MVPNVLVFMVSELKRELLGFAGSCFVEIFGGGGEFLPSVLITPGFSGVATGCFLLMA